MKSSVINVLIVLFFIFPLFFSVEAFSDEEEMVLMMATTTSTDNTGLLDYLAPRLKADTGIELRWVAVGTGLALSFGKYCDVDVVMVHDPEAEADFMKDGYGIDRTPFMFNDFVLIGPADDPAGVRGIPAPAALSRIALSRSYFASRGDKSGTHMRELSLWKAAGLPMPDREKWYLQTGQGMLATIAVAEELKGYTLTDRGTFIKFEADHGGRPPLVILVEGDRSLLNQYSVIAVNPARCPDARYEIAKGFIEWLINPEIQMFIGDFTIQGKRLFIPNAGER